jgi:Skp family chaperone for outer membrane proteins
MSKEFTSDVAKIINSKNEQIKQLEQKVAELQQQVKNLIISDVVFSEARAEVCKKTDAWRKCKSWKNDCRCLKSCPLHLQT